ncbi:hypothetical protein NWE59_03085 [Mycoplasmopsis felis]|uniref:M13-type metalloendopeptidase n=1 Tax=Mycoplasmopsis felis TaxID=33923 RepID=UPI0021AEBD06|nr:M13-type metalloendopeptidase [Mycoplasmopsis felis]UWV79001.1 hypothetical protein NWE59_03085 [Mycoplasmopsis felis]
MLIIIQLKITLSFLGILSSPFYNINASKSSNYGSIGAVIAHFKFLTGSIIMELNLMKMVH